MLNWVERKAKRETMLREHRDEFWNEVCVVLQDCCDSFKKHYSEDLDCQLESNRRVLVTRRTTLRSVLIALDRRCIEVTIYQQPTQTFDLDADENGVFIRSRSGRITPDELSQLALESILFGPYEQPRPVSNRPPEQMDYPTAEGFLSSLHASGHQFTPSLKGLLSRVAFPNRNTSRKS